MYHASSAYYSPLLDVGLPQSTPQDPISRFVIQSLPATLFKVSASSIDVCTQNFHVFHDIPP